MTPAGNGSFTGDFDRSRIKQFRRHLYLDVFAMSPRATDLNLLFGIMAVQNDFIPRDALIEAMGAWVLDKSRRLGEILVQHGDLTADRCALLDALVNEHLKLHNNDPEQSLAAAASVSSLRWQLSQIADPDLQASLHVAGSAHLADPDSTELYVPREATDRPSLPDSATARQGWARRSLRRRGLGAAPRNSPQGNPVRPRPGRRQPRPIPLGGGSHRPARAPRHCARVRAGSIRRRPALLCHAVHPRRQSQGGDPPFPRSREVRPRPGRAKPGPAPAPRAFRRCVQRRRLRPQPRRAAPRLETRQRHARQIRRNAGGRLGSGQDRRQDGRDRDCRRDRLCSRVRAVEWRRPKWVRPSARPRT